MIYAIVVVTIVIIFSINRLRNKKPADICEICEKPLKKPIWIDELAFCPKHAEHYESAEWVCIQSGHSTPETPSFGVNMYKFKLFLVEKGVPSVIKASYDQVGNEVITKMELFVREEDQEKAKSFSRPD